MESLGVLPIPGYKSWNNVYPAGKNYFLVYQDRQKRSQISKLIPRGKDRPPKLQSPSTKKKKSKMTFFINHLSSNGNYLACVMKDGSIIRWNTETNMIHLIASIPMSITDLRKNQQKAQTSHKIKDKGKCM